MIEEKRRASVSDLLDPEFHKRCMEEALQKCGHPTIGRMHKPKEVELPDLEIEE